MLSEARCFQVNRLCFELSSSLSKDLWATGAGSSGTWDALWDPSLWVVSGPNLFREPVLVVKPLAWTWVCNILHTLVRAALWTSLLAWWALERRSRPIFLRFDDEGTRQNDKTSFCGYFYNIIIHNFPPISSWGWKLFDFHTNSSHNIRKP